MCIGGFILVNRPLQFPYMDYLKMPYLSEKHALVQICCKNRQASIIHIQRQTRKRCGPVNFVSPKTPYINDAKISCLVKHQIMLEGRNSHTRYQKVWHGRNYKHTQSRRRSASMLWNCVDRLLSCAIMLVVSFSLSEIKKIALRWQGSVSVFQCFLLSQNFPRYSSRTLSASYYTMPVVLYLTISLSLVNAILSASCHFAYSLSFSFFLSSLSILSPPFKLLSHWMWSNGSRMCT